MIASRLYAWILKACICAVSVTLAGHGAYAGAFLLNEGETRIIVSSAFDKSDRFFDSAGKLRPLAEYRKFEMVTYAEYGATDWLTLIFAPSSSQSTGSIAVADLRGLTDSADRFARFETGARVRAWYTQNSVVSFQVSIRAPYAFDRGLPPGLRKEVNELDSRMLLGYNFVLWERGGYASVELAYRLRAGAADEWRADITLGYRVMPDLLLLMQNFNVITKAQAPAPYTRSHKFQLSAVYEFMDSWSIQAGVYAVPFGVNIRAEKGIMSALWRKF